MVDDDFTKILADHHWADVYQDFENPVYGRLATGKQFVLIQTQAAPPETYKSLYDKCKIMMRDTGGLDCHWLECTGLWIEEGELEGQAERLQNYESVARKLAHEVIKSN